METIKTNTDLNISQLIESAKKLSPKDRLKLNDTNWNGEMAIPIEHQKIVLERMERAKANPEHLLDWDEVSKML